MELVEKIAAQGYLGAIVPRSTAAQDSTTSPMA